MRLGCTVVAALVLLPANAFAEPAVVRPTKRVGTESLYDIVGTPPNADGIVLARQTLPAAGTTAGLAQSRVVYLNKGAVTISPGGNDSRTNKSSLAQNQIQLGGWTPDPAVWSETVGCLRDLFAPYDLSFTETDPGNVAHIEAIFGGRSSLFGLSNDIAGVAPFTADCSIIENLIVFTFVDQLPANPRLICEIQAQEIAHAFGLDHELLAADPMSYLSFEGNRVFQDQIAPCGENEIRPCGLNGTVCRRGQNSVALLNERLGAKNDPIAPEVSFVSPSEGMVVPPRFTLRVNATDNIIVRSATFYVDGALVGEVTTEPFELALANDLAEGKHALRVDVTDGKQSKSDAISVEVQIGAPDPDAASNADGDVSGGCSSSGAPNAMGIFWLLLAFAVQSRRAHR